MLAVVLAGCGTEPRVITDQKADIDSAVAGITAADFAMRLAALADDSTRGRLAPSPENDKAATWVFDQLSAAGTHPIRQQFLLYGELVANVIGSVTGGDTALAEEVVLVTSHFDHIGTVNDGLGCARSLTLPQDSICNGADDNASGTVGVIEVARAVARLQRRPARTIVFAAFNGEEEGLVGSQWYTLEPTVLFSSIVAVINLDMIARHPPDTARLVRMSRTSMGAVVQRLAADHPDLKLTPVETTAGWTQSDHYPFAQAGIPALFFCSGAHVDLHNTGDNPDRADAAQASRIAKLAAYTVIDVANTPARPVWR